MPEVWPALVLINPESDLILDTDAFFPMRDGPERRLLANGRVLPDLLFATDPDRLRANVGAAADSAIALIGEAGKALLEVADGPDVWEKVADAAGGRAGVVLVGGHDVLRMRSTSALPGALRKSLVGSFDADAFIVWNDDLYGDTDGDHAAELPVTRIPDGHSGALLLQALVAAPGTPERERFGLHNIARPYATDIFSRVAGSEAMIASEPASPGDGRTAGMNARNLYIVLHGNSADCGNLFGETAASAPLRALSVACVPDLQGGTALLGACYGGLTVDRTALDDPAGDLSRVLGPEDSIALQLLARGALAVVGCTGTHYSPTGPIYDALPMCYTGAPVHELFWQHIQSGRSPATALYQAKIDYLSFLPYCGGDSAAALNLKHWRQFTCLGLGW